MSVNPLDNEDLYDAITLGGVRSPGVVTLSGHDRKIGWDIKKGPGQSGASITRTSEDPVEFTASFFLATREQIQAWPAFLDLIKSTVAGTTPKALDIYHPDLASNDIKSVVLSTIVGVKHRGNGGQDVDIKFLEYRPAKNRGGSPNGSKTRTTKQKAPDPNQDLLDELSKLTNQYQNTEWK